MRTFMSASGCHPSPTRVGSAPATDPRPRQGNAGDDTKDPLSYHVHVSIPRGGRPPATLPS